MFEFEKILKGLREFAESEVPLDLLFISANEVKADFQNRVFNSEDGSKDRTGKGLGGYSNKWAKVRREAGRQTKFKDLEFTGSLRRSIRTARTDDEIQILITSSLEVKKAVDLERITRKDIFSLSDSEIESFTEKSVKLFNNEIKEIINNAQNNT
jgi:hypothetical protein